MSYYKCKNCNYIWESRTKRQPKACTKCKSYKHIVPYDNNPQDPAPIYKEPKPQPNKRRAINISDYGI